MTDTDLAELRQACTTLASVRCVRSKQTLELMEENARLRSEAEQNFGAGEIVIEIGKTLEQLGCRHGQGPSHSNTPPMMFREWLLCAIGKREDEIARLRTVPRIPGGIPGMSND